VLNGKVTRNILESNHLLVCPGPVNIFALIVDHQPGAEIQHYIFIKIPIKLL